MVLVPAHAGTGAEGVFDTAGVVEAGGDDLEDAGDEGWAFGHGKGERLLRWKRVGGRRGVVDDVTAGCVGVKPLADVALEGAGALCEFSGRDGLAVSHGLVEAEPVADQDEDGVE